MNRAIDLNSVNLIKSIIHNELFRIIFIFAVVTYVAFPHLNSYLATPGADAQFYFFLINDYLSQLRLGYFPYMNQASFSPMSIPMIPMAPYLFFLAGFFDLITFHSLSFGAIFNLCIVFSLYFGALLFYFLLLKVDPKLRWQAASLAILFILSQGVAGLLYNRKLYFSVMAIPFVPLLFYGLYRGFSKKDSITYCIVGGALCLLWISHPPIAFVCTGLTLAVQLSQLFLEKSKYSILKIIMGTYIIFFVLSLFYFVSLAEIGFNNLRVTVYSSSPFALQAKMFINGLMDYLNRARDLVFLFPNHDVFRVSRLGISLWAVIIITLFYSWKKLSLYRITFSILFTIMFLMIYPVPGITQFLWSAIIFLTHSSSIFQLFYDGQVGDRFYICMATMCIFLSITTCKEANNNAKKLFLILYLLGIAYSICELHYSMNDELYLCLHNSTRLEMQKYTKALSLPENENTVVLSSYMGFDKQSFNAFFDPLLETRIISLDGQIVQSPKEILIKKFSLNNSPRNFEVSFAPQKDHDDSFPSLVLAPNQRYIMKFLFEIKDMADWTLIFKGDHFYRIYGKLGGNLIPGNNYALSFWQTGNKPEKIDLRIFGSCADSKQQCKVILKNIAFEPYNIMDKDLPIHLLSVFPYKALITNIQKDSFLETHKKFINNYIVKVNGNTVPYTKSDQGRVLIPIKAGKSEVTINYQFTKPMVFAFLISFISWIILILLLFRHSFQKPKL